jgi:iron complex transport system ATP-binding protein
VAPFVEIRDVHAGYARQHGELGEHVLHGVSASLPRGVLCALLGPNGAGKSTLLRVIAGVIAPTRGEATIDGRALARLEAAERARVVAVVPQHIDVAFGFTVREVVEMGRAPHQGTFMRQRREDRVAVERALAACELEAFVDRPVASLSGGEQKRVHIARALAQETPVLLLDEAGAHLDVQHTVSLYALLARQVRELGLTCVAAMHDFNAALEHADQALLLHQGGVVGAGPTGEVVEPALLSRVFGVELERCVRPSGGTVLAIVPPRGAPESRPSEPADL